MARRGRVTRLKGHTRTRNKNPKLSPFQREQKRAQLANQAPTARSMGTTEDIPHSQRTLYAYLQERQKRAADRRRLQGAQNVPYPVKLDALEKARADTESDETARTKESVCTSAGASTFSDHKAKAGSRRSNKGSRVSATNSGVGASAQVVKMTDSHKLRCEPTSLNAELFESVSSCMRQANTPDTNQTGEDTQEHESSVNEIIARKKARKHSKKRELRQKRVSERMHALETQLQTILRPRSRKRHGGDGATRQNGESEGGGFNIAFERELRKMNKAAEVIGAEGDSGATVKKASRTKRGKAQDRQHDESKLLRDDDDNEDERTGQSKDSSNESNEQKDNPDNKCSGTERATCGTSATTQTKKPTDFFELVDMVRYGERVDAPPLLDVVPNPHAAASRLANRLTKPTRTNKRGGSSSSSSSISAAATHIYTDDMHGAVAHSPDTPRITFRGKDRVPHAPSAVANTELRNAAGADGRGAIHASKISQYKKEAERLREDVMARYKQNKYNNLKEKPGVNMNHVFPRFA